MEPLTLFLLVLRAALLSSGGLGTLPILHQDFAGHGWASDRVFGEALAIGQVGPGPSGLWVVSLGYLTLGIPGGVLAGLAVSLPPLLVFGVARLHDRFGARTDVRGFVRGLTLGLAASVPVIFLGVVGAYGFDLAGAAVATASLVLIATRRVPYFAVLAAAGAAGALVYR